HYNHSSTSTMALRQLVFFISDGIFDGGAREKAKRWVRHSMSQGQLVVLVIVEQHQTPVEKSTIITTPSSTGVTSSSNSSRQALHLNASSRVDSILDTTRVVRDAKSGSWQTVSYLEDYPFPYYIILRDTHTLPEVLGDALRQWFELLAASTGDSTSM